MDRREHRVTERGVSVISASAPSESVVESSFVDDMHTMMGHGGRFAQDGRYAGVVHGLARWWDSVELWLTGLPFALQVGLVMVVLSLIAILVVRVLSALIDRVADVLDARLARAERADVAGRGPGEGNDDGV
ncbi:hypothetical protein [Tsukamurella sp. PLM1]|uniref:hypothetical protein n=1 Tax=Tsukamurella sp. PLM1 TaxID=2929795 RepID=UPI0020553085|nr:hypothetical protein [Tsukamurella sp. PLM1]BDH58273.1 hypothetical protein MTP03_32120 [Tsukamurella sp. PLM1]